MQQLHVAMPGKVEVYSETTHLADVQPLVKTRTTQSPLPAKDLPIIPNVPVIHPRCTKGAVIVPLAAGDLVTLIFSDRALDTWKASLGSKPAEPGNNRRHHLSDCWAIPGGYPSALPFTPAYAGALALQVSPGTKIALGNGAVEVLDLLDQMITLFVDAMSGVMLTYQTHNHSSAGAGPPADAANWLSAMTSLTTLQTLLQQLKA